MKFPCEGQQTQLQLYSNKIWELLIVALRQLQSMNKETKTWLFHLSGHVKSSSSSNEDYKIKQEFWLAWWAQCKLFYQIIQNSSKNQGGALDYTKIMQNVIIRNPKVWNVVFPLIALKYLILVSAPAWQLQIGLQKSNSF